MFTDRYFHTDDGLKLHLRDYAPKVENSNTHPVICLPGLSRNVRDFHKIAEILSHSSTAPRRVIVLNYRGRGQSQWDDDKTNYNIVREAKDVIIALNELNISNAHFIGTSRGGLIIHILATMQPELMSAIIFNDIGPEIELAGLLEIQNYLDQKRSPQTWQEAADMQRRIHGATFTDLSDAEWMDMAHEIYIERDGKIIPDFDPHVVDSIRVLDTQTELPTLWDQFKLLYGNPVMTIRGENSSLFSVKTLARMDNDHPDHQSITIEKQGHPPILHCGELSFNISQFLDAKD